MKKLSALIAVLFVGSALSLGACKKDEKKEEPKAKTTEPAKTDPAKTEPAKTEPAKTEPATGGAATGLAECDAYITAMEKYLTCDKIPQATRDAAKQGMDAMKQGWGDTSALPDDVKKQTNDACKSSVDALKQGATALGCTI